MNNQYSKKIQCILKEGERCKKLLGPAAGPRGATGPTGPTGPTGQCNKSSIYIFKW